MDLCGFIEGVEHYVCNANTKIYISNAQGDKCEFNAWPMTDTSFHLRNAFSSISNDLVKSCNRSPRALAKLDNPFTINLFIHNGFISDGRSF